MENVNVRIRKTSDKQLKIMDRFLCSRIVAKHLMVINPFVPNEPFLYQLKTSESREVF